MAYMAPYIYSHILATLSYKICEILAIDIKIYNFPIKYGPGPESKFQHGASELNAMHTP